MSLDDRFSGWLDGELDAEEKAAVEAEIAADPVVATEVESLRAVRLLLRTQGHLAVRPAAVEHLIAGVEIATRDRGVVAAPAVVSLRPRRRVPLLAAVAASFVLVVSVIGGVGGASTLPAVGDLIARHDAAAAVMTGEGTGAEHDDMPVMGEVMGETMEMMSVHRADGVAHAVYAAVDGSAVSVFRQDGDFDAELMAADLGGDVGEMDGHDMWSADLEARHVAVLDGEGYVWILVSDVDVDPMADLMPDMLDELPTRAPSITERVRSVVRAVVEPFEIRG